MKINQFLREKCEKTTRCTTVYTDFFALIYLTPGSANNKFKRFLGFWPDCWCQSFKCEIYQKKLPLTKVFDNLKIFYQLRFLCPSQFYLNLFILFIYSMCWSVLMYLLSIIVRVLTELKRDSITGVLIVSFEQVFPKWLNDICKHENKKGLSTVVFRKISLYSENLFYCILIYYLQF